MAETCASAKDTKKAVDKREKAKGLFKRQQEKEN